MITISVTPAHGTEAESFAVYRDTTPIGTIYPYAETEYNVSLVHYEAYMGDSQRYLSTYPSFTAAMDAIANYTEED